MYHQTTTTTYTVYAENIPNAKLVVLLDEAELVIRSVVTADD